MSMTGDTRGSAAHLNSGHDTLSRARYSEEDDNEVVSSFTKDHMQMMQGSAVRPNEGLGNFFAGIVHNSAHRLNDVAVSPHGPPLLRCDKPLSVVKNQPLTPQSLAPAPCSIEIPASESGRPASLGMQHWELSRSSNGSTAAAAMAIAAAAAGGQSWQTPVSIRHCSACVPNAPGRGGAVAPGLPTAQPGWDCMSPVAAQNNAAQWQQLLRWLDSTGNVLPEAAAAVTAVDK